MAFLSIVIILASIVIAGNKVIHLYRYHLRRNRPTQPPQYNENDIPLVEQSQPTQQTETALIPYILSGDTLSTISFMLTHSDPLYALYVGHQLLLYLPIQHHMHASTAGLIPYPDVITELNVHIPERTAAEKIPLELNPNSVYFLKIEKVDEKHIKVSYIPAKIHSEPNELLIDPSKHEYLHYTYVQLTKETTPQRTQQAQQYMHTLPARKIEEKKDTA